MRKITLLAAFAACCSIANAAITAELAAGFPTPAGGGLFDWVYEVNLDQRSRLDTDTGAQQFVIYEFAGYVGGSIFTPGPDWVGTVQALGPVPAGISIVAPYPADTNTVNLVFTYNGPDFPGPAFLGLFGAQSPFSEVTSGTQTSQTTNNTPTFQNGKPNASIDTVDVPSQPLQIDSPEPASLVMIGSGLIGLVMFARRKRA